MPIEVTKWLCDECELEYDDYEEALKCCKKK